MRFYIRLVKKSVKSFNKSITSNKNILCNLFDILLFKFISKNWIILTSKAIYLSTANSISCKLLLYLLHKNDFFL